MLDTLLATKLYFPSLRPDLVARPRLAQRLAPAKQRALTLVCAPAGYGKTTLVATALADLEREKKVAWLSLDEEDNDPARFWVYVIAALRQVQTGSGEQALALLQSPQPSPLPTVLTALINDVAACPDHLVLVLDDYHVIKIQPIHEGLTFLMEHQPPQLHLVLTSRVDPPLPLHRLRARGELHELREADLRFTPEEAASLLHGTAGIALPGEVVQSLEARTEGWAAGLQLAALSLQGIADPADFVQAFSGSHRHLVDYLTEEVLLRQPQAVQQFLLHTAVLDRFCASLCETIFSRVNGQENGEAGSLRSGDSSQRLIEHAEQANLFLVPLDTERRWYRYHHLFADLLRFRARQTLPAERLRAIHQQAALWFEEAGLWAEAINHALAAEAYDVAGRVVAHQAIQVLVRGEVATLVEWLAALPPSQMTTDPRLRLAGAWAGLFSGKAEETEVQLQQALELLGVPAFAGEGALLGEALAVRATLAMVCNNMAQNIADSEKALALLPADYLPLRSLVAWHMAFAYRSCGQTEQSMRAYRQAIALSEQGGNRLINLSARRELGELMLGQGDLHGAQVLLTRLVEAATAGGWTSLYPVSAAYIHLGEIHYELNHLETATASVLAGLALPNAAFMNFDAYGYALLGHIYAAQNELARAREAIHEAEQRVLQAGHPQRRALTLARIACFWLKAGEVARAASWLPDGRDVPQDACHPVYIQQQISRARYLLAAGERDAAEGIVDELLAPAEAGGRVRDTVGLRLMQAQLLAGIEAEAAVARALRASAPVGLLRTFVDEGMVIGQLLARLQGQEGVPPVYLQQLLAAFAREGERPGNLLLLEPLSQRELEVLRLVAQGYSNREIAATLVFTVATAKKHLEHILGKLSVRNRTEAVARARELELL